MKFKKRILHIYKDNLIRRYTFAIFAHATDNNIIISYKYHIIEYNIILLKSVEESLFHYISDIDFIPLLPFPEFQLLTDE